MKELRATYRTTFALDEVAKKRIKRLSKKWKVSHAEVIRPSLEQAEIQDDAKHMDLIKALDELEASGHTLSSESAAEYLAQNKASRIDWRGHK